MLWQQDSDYLEGFEDLAVDYNLVEERAVKKLLQQTEDILACDAAIAALAREFTLQVRDSVKEKTGIAGLMQHYDLSTEEGVLLMCVAEALLRIPDHETEKLLISDKLSGANWQAHLGKSHSSFVNTATWGLVITGKLLAVDDEATGIRSIWKKMIKRCSEGTIRQAVTHAIKLISEEFVLGQSIKDAFVRGKESHQAGYSFSFDMLGEAALTAADAEKYFAAYDDALDELVLHIDSNQTIFKRPNISVKLSALYPRYEFSHQAQAIVALTEKLKQLAIKAKRLGVALTVDAEEADRLEMSLEIFKRVFEDDCCEGWEGLGLALQTYQKRAPALIEWLKSLAEANGRRIQVRCVKGAYWDTEIKQAQMEGLESYPVYTRKVSTDVSYLVCAKLLLQSQDLLYPKFATHNAYTAAAVVCMANHLGVSKQFEFQSLQGMGTALHQQLLARGFSCRIYAPIGSYKELLPYLVRRLLENGANTSFVNQIANDAASIEELIANPIHKVQARESIANPAIPLPQDIFPGRVNSQGINITNSLDLQQLTLKVNPFLEKTYSINMGSKNTDSKSLCNPADLKDTLGQRVDMSAEEVAAALDLAHAAFPQWDATPVTVRADMLRKAADLLEQNTPELIALLIRESGKVLADALSEIREAVDFCRYYALQAERNFMPMELPGYTGETDTLHLRGRGVLLCISPWNFPLAIFLGQVAAALVTGSCVLAKPADPSSIISAKVVDLLYLAGIPKDVCQLLWASGRDVGDAVLSRAECAGVIFTGSNATSKIIQRQLAANDHAIVPFIAETGGINAMIADSSALPEQLVSDVVLSAFGSCGQRCSALRVLCIQEDVADRVLEMLIGAMQQLNIGDPRYYSTDIGPVIDTKAKDDLQGYITKMKAESKLLYECQLPGGLSGHYIAPCVFELDTIEQLQREVFGPVLHVVRYKAQDLDSLLDQINALGYGLTFGVHSRIDTTIDKIKQKIRVGNVYVNRNMIGAVVGLQPFGGCGLSGTGPKAGGPHYLLRLCNETTVCTDTTAAGGNASLMAMEDDSFSC